MLDSVKILSLFSFLFSVYCGKSGAFKFRGACNAVLSLDAEQAAKGVVTHSRFCKSLFPYYERLMLYCVLISFVVIDNDRVNSVWIVDDTPQLSSLVNPLLGYC